MPSPLEALFDQQALPPPPPPKRSATGKGDATTFFRARVAPPACPRAQIPSVGSLWPQCHDVPTRDCAQCRFLAHHDKWTTTIGSYRYASGSRTEVVQWLVERPFRLGGQFAMGCAVCASLIARLRECDAPPCDRRRWSTKWGRFEVSGVLSMQAETIKWHSMSDVHRIAMRCFLSPGAPVITTLPDPEDVALLRGHVPQPEQWVRMWACVRNPTSYAAAAQMQATESFLSSTRCPQVAVAASRRALASMVKIMAEAIRCEKRGALRRSTAICLSLDDRGEFRLIRFRCSGPELAANPGLFARGIPASEPGRPRLQSVREGLFAVMRRGGAPTAESLESLDADYSDKMKDSILRAIDTFSTPLAGALDVQLRDHILGHLFTYTADGAAPVVKCAKLLQSRCPRLVLIIRDVAHQVRTSTMAPLMKADGFKDFWAGVFDDTSALVPSVQHSDAWRDKLEKAQRFIIKDRGCQGGFLRVTLKHLSFAKQRFDSAACPARKYCCLLSAIAVLLLCIVCDSRVDRAKRKLATEHLNNMTPSRITIAGLFADYSSECLDFVRTFDRHYHDIANTHREVVRFRSRMRSLFHDGHIFQEAPEGARGQTCTSIALTQAKELGRIYYGDRVLELWPLGSKAGAVESLAKLQEVVQVVEARLDAELPTCSLHVAFSSFDLRTWHTVCVLEDRGSANDADALLRKLRRWVQQLATAHPMVRSDGADRTVADFEAAARAARRAHRDKFVGQQASFNVETWESLLLGGLPCLQVSAQVCRLIEWYLSITDSTGPVERNLGRMTAVLSAHTGGMDDDGRHLGSILEADMDGPTCEAELFEPDPATTSSRSVGPSERPPAVQEALEVAPGCRPRHRMTEFTRRCARLWVQHHRRRFCVYQRKRQVQARPPVAGTDASAMRGQKRALSALFTEALKPEATQRKTILGVSRTSLLAKAKLCASPSPGLIPFRKKTQEKMADQLKLAARRCSGQGYVVPPLRLGQIFESRLIAQQPAQGRCVCLCVGGPLRCSSPDVHCREFRADAWQSVRGVDLVVLEDSRDLGLTVSAPRYDLALAVVALGKPVISRTAFASIDGRPDMSTSTIRHKPAVREPCDITLAKQFAEKHSRVAKVLTACASADGSKWKVRVEAAPPARSGDGVHISALADVAVLIRQRRRFARVGGVVLNR